MTHAFRPGDVLARRYRLVDLLVESGSGRFWRAHDVVLDRHVALHTIAADDGRSQDLLDAARAATTVSDRRLLRVLDAAVDDDICYVVNEWGSGISLDILVGGGKVLAPRHAAWLVSQVADSVARAHAAGIAHGRLAPENVLVDRHGQVRVIGLCVDAALHGVPHDRVSTDVADLAGLLYCALTASWAGTSRSDVRRAPVEHGHVLRPRRVRAGVPRPLDQLCDLVLHPHAGTRGRVEATARGLAGRLEEFVGDDAGIPDALVAMLPPVRERFPLTLPPVPEVRPHDRADALGGPTSAVDDDSTVATERPTSPDPTPDPTPDPAPAPEADDLPTQAVAAAPRQPATPDAPDVPEDAPPPEGSGRRARPTPGPPPPPLPDPPARPLFAPDPADGGPVRRPRTQEGVTTTTARAGSTYWPWETGSRELPAVDATGSGVLPAVEEPVPGRRWLRLAVVLLVLLGVLVAAVVVYNLGRGRTPLGAEPEPTSPATPSSTPSPDPVAVTGLAATDLDPQGDPPAENPEQAPLAVDGDTATAWTTVRYFQQLGPGGLKTGVGLAVDLGRQREVALVEVDFAGAPTSAEVFVADEEPAGVDGLTSIGAITEAADGSVEPTSATSARWVVVWLTALPPATDGFTGGIGEVRVLEVPGG